MSLKGLLFTLDVDGQDPDTFAVVSFRLDQHLSQPFALSGKASVSGAGDDSGSGEGDRIPDNPGNGGDDEQDKYYLHFCFTDDNGFPYSKARYIVFLKIIRKHVEEQTGREIQKYSLQKVSRQ